MTLDALKLELRAFLKSQGLPDAVAVNIVSAPVVTDGEPIAEYTKLFDIPAVNEPDSTLVDVKIAGVKASSEYKDRDFAKYVLDGNPETHFAAKGKGQSLILELGGKQEIKEIHIKWYEGHLRRMEYEIYKHIDHTDPNFQWIRLGSALSSGTANNEYENHVFDQPFVTDSIKIIGLGNSLNSFMSIVDLKVKGRQLQEPQEPCADPHAHKDSEGNCVCDDGYESKDGQCVKKEGGCSGGGGTVEEGTVIYDSENDFKANVGKTLTKEKPLAPENVFRPSHAGGGDQGPDNHKVLQRADGQIVKQLNGQKTRDYLDAYAKNPEGYKNLELEVDDFTLDETADDLSVKFGWHSDPTGKHIFAGFGGSLHRKTAESKAEFNHADESGGSNNGGEVTKALSKEIVFDGKTKYSMIARIQERIGKKEKVMTMLVKYPNSSEFVPVLTNRVWNDGNWWDDDKKKAAYQKDPMFKTAVDAKEVLDGVPMEALGRLWVRLNTKVSKKGILQYAKCKVKVIGPLA